MSKSIKLKNDTYIDSSSIAHNKEKLSDILNTESRILIFNEEYVYSSDLQYDCFKIGKMVVLNIHTIGFKQNLNHGELLISGLPKPNEAIIFHFYGGNESSGLTIRCVLDTNGNILTHYGGTTSVGSSANKQFGGTFIYRTNE